MKPTRQPFQYSVLTALLLVAAALAVHGHAQGQGRLAQQRVLVQVAEVKPDMVSTFMDVVKTQTIPALKKSGVAWLQVWTPIFGHTFTYIAMSPISNYTQFEGTGPVERALGTAYPAYSTKFRQTLVGAHEFTQTLRQDASIQSNEASLANFATIQTFQTLPGKASDLVQLMTSDFIPGYKKAGSKDLWVYTSNFGAPAGQVMVFRPFDDINEMNGNNPLNRGLTPETLQQAYARRNALVVSENVEIVRPVRELSFNTPR